MDKTGVNFTFNDEELVHLVAALRTHSIAYQKELNDPLVSIEDNRVNRADLIEVQRLIEVFESVVE